MNVLNFEPRNAMDTRRTEHAGACIARSNGLIKSASTSTCCAAENALFQKAHHRQFLISSAEHADYEDEPPSPDAAPTDYPKLPSLSLSHAAVLARNAALRFDHDHRHHAAKTSLQHQLRVNRVTHFSDCHLNKLGLPTANDHQQLANGGTAAACNGDTKREEFNSHRALDNVLINRSQDGHSASIINFTSVNDVKPTAQPRPSNGMSCTPDDGCSTTPAENDGSSVSGNSSERRRKISVFDASSAAAAADRAPAVSDGDVPAPPKANDTVESLCQKLAAVTTNECSSSGSGSSSSGGGSPPPAEKEEKRFRRSSSLKMPKENDSNPAQKKIVRFADALGLDLADVRTFLDELPSVPKSAYSDLQQAAEPCAERLLAPHGTPPPPPETKTLVPMFRQPHTSPLFLDRVRDNFVSLEFAKVTAAPVCSISGTVRVRNLDFCKSVYVRYSTDGWRSFAELQAVYVPDSCDGFSDKFAFVVYVYEATPNLRLELAVRFHCSGSIFWDNNNGANYVFQCLPSAPIVPSYFQCFGPIAGDAYHSFY